MLIFYRCLAADYMNRTLENILLFQIGWLAVVMLGAGPYHWAAPAIVLAVVWRHVSRSADPRTELRLTGFALIFGLLWENALTAMTVVVYPHGQIVGWLAPVWILLMWPMMATTLNVAMRWLHRRVWLGALFGAIGGPLAFLAGERLDAVVFPDPFLAMTVLAMGWAILFPMLVGLARRQDGVRPLATPEEPSP